MERKKEYATGRGKYGRKMRKVRSCEKEGKSQEGRQKVGLAGEKEDGKMGRREERRKEDENDGTRERKE